jgi:hypothetical protein
MSKNAKNGLLYNWQAVWYCYGVTNDLRHTWQSWLVPYGIRKSTYDKPGKQFATLMEYELMEHMASCLVPLWSTNDLRHTWQSWLIPYGIRKSTYDKPGKQFGTLMEYELTEHMASCLVHLWGTNNDLRAHLASCLCPYGVRTTYGTHGKAVWYPCGVRVS